MFSLLPSLWKTPQPQRVPTDRVIPVGFFDDTIIFRNFVFYTTFVIDDVLDHEKLHICLVRLLSRPGWNKLGARLRRNDLGELEHHIPQAFSPERPAVAYEHVDLSDLAVEDHPSASKIPRPPEDGRPRVIGDPNVLSELYTGPGIPKGPDDYLYTDRPQLGLRVISFKNSTIVVLHWLHLSLDAIALGSLLKAWTLMLQGRESEILEPLSDYPLEDLGKNPTEPHLLVDQRLSTIGLARWLFWNLYNLAIRPRGNRIVCIPAAYLKDLREKAMKELATQAALEGITEPPFLSEGDVILAWLARVGFSNLPRDSKQPVALQQAFEWRKALFDLMPANRPTLGNCVGFTVTVIPAKDLLQRPLSYVASQIRGALNVQRSREQIEAYTSFIREDPRNRAPPLFGDVSMKLLMFSNWQKAKLYETDFSAAARNPTSTPLFPSYIQTVQGPYNFNDGLIMVGKDPNGNYWFGGYRAEGLWEMMNRKMQEDENEPQSETGFMEE